MNKTRSPFTNTSLLPAYFLPLPRAATLAYLRHAITVARRMKKESHVGIARGLGITKGQLAVLRGVGNSYLKASPCVRRLKEACPGTATSILFGLSNWMEFAHWSQVEAASLVIQTKAKVVEWARANGHDPDLDDYLLYRKHRERWLKSFRRHGITKTRDLFAWVDECETGMRAPQALDGLPSE